MVHSGASMSRTEGDAETAGGDEGLIETGTLECFLRYLARIIGDGPHGFTVLTLEIVHNWIIDSPKNLGMDVLSQQAVLLERLDSGNSIHQIVENLRTCAADGGDGCACGDDDPSLHKAPV